MNTISIDLPLYREPEITEDDFMQYTDIIEQAELANCPKYWINIIRESNDVGTNLFDQLQQKYHFYPVFNGNKLVKLVFESKKYYNLLLLKYG